MRVDLGCRARREECGVAGHTNDEQHSQRAKATCSALALIRNSL
jgi:hypothetical protein